MTSGLAIAASVAAFVVPASALVSLPFWYASAAPYLRRFTGRVHPAADLCIRLLDMRIGWRGDGRYDDLRHEGGAAISMSWDRRVRTLTVSGSTIELNAASKAALTLAVRRYVRAQDRHQKIREQAQAEKAVAAFAHKIADMYDPDKVVPIKRRAS